MKKTTDAQRREQLLVWFRKIEEQARRLAVDHYIFKEVTDMIARNKRLEDQASNEFFRWMRDNFVVCAGVAVRRQADRDHRSISMRRFLEELRSNPHLVSRKYFVDLHKDSNVPENMAQRTYDRVVGESRNELDPTQVEHEIEELERRTDLIKHIVNKTFAHTDKKGPSKPPPEFKDLEGCIDFFEDLVKRYYLLLYARSLASLLPTFQYEWSDIFRFPWIEDS